VNTNTADLVDFVDERSSRFSPPWMIKLNVVQINLISDRMS